MDEWWPTDDEDNQSKVLNDNWGFDIDTTQNLFFFFLTTFTVMVIEFFYTLTSAKGARVRMRV